LIVTLTTAIRGQLVTYFRLRLAVVIFHYLFDDIILTDSIFISKIGMTAQHVDNMMLSVISLIQRHVIEIVPFDRSHSTSIITSYIVSFLWYNKIVVENR